MEQCNGGAVQVVSLLSSGGSGDIDNPVVYKDQALVCFEGKGGGNLDGFYGCGIISCEHLFHLRDRLVAARRSPFFTGPLTPVSPLCNTESKTGAAWEIPKTAPVFVFGDIQLWYLFRKPPVS